MGLNLIFDNDWDFLKMQLKSAWGEKMHFIYTLLIPILILFLNKNLYFPDDITIYIYWSYIVVTTVFHGFLINLVRWRENGRFKNISLLVKSDHTVILTNILVQLIVIQIEIACFNLIMAIFVTHLSWETFVYGFLASFLAVLISSSMWSMFLLLKLKRGTFNILTGLIFILGLISLGIRPQGIMKHFLVIVSPFQLTYELYNIAFNETSLQVLLGICAGVYIIVGIILLWKISLRTPRHRL